MAYKRRSNMAYGRPAKERLKTKLHLLPETYARFALINAELEKHGSLAPSRTLCVEMALELLYEQVKRSPTAVIKRLRALSNSPVRVEEGGSKLDPSLTGLRLLDSLRLTAPPTDPGETCFNTTVDIAEDAAGRPLA